MGKVGNSSRLDREIEKFTEIVLNERSNNVL